MSLAPQPCRKVRPHFQNLTRSPSGSFLTSGFPCITARACNTILISFHWAKSLFICPQIKQKKIAEGRQETFKLLSGWFLYVWRDQVFCYVCLVAHKGQHLMSWVDRLQTSTLKPFLHMRKRYWQRGRENSLTKWLDPICKTSTPSM